MNRKVAVVVRVVAEPFAAPVARVNADRVRAKEVHVSHVPHEALPREE